MPTLREYEADIHDFYNTEFTNSTLKGYVFKPLAYIDVLLVYAGSMSYGKLVYTMELAADSTDWSPVKESHKQITASEFTIRSEAYWNNEPMSPHPCDIGMRKESYFNKELEVSCSCKSSDLFNFGCKCGYLEKSRT